MSVHMLSGIHHNQRRQRRSPTQWARLPGRLPRPRDLSSTNISCSRGRNIFSFSFSLSTLRQEVWERALHRLGSFAQAAPVRESTHPTLGALRLRLFLSPLPSIHLRTCVSVQPARLLLPLPNASSANSQPASKGTNSPGTRRDPKCGLEEPPSLPVLRLVLWRAPSLAQQQPP